MFIMRTIVPWVAFLSLTSASLAGRDGVQVASNTYRKYQPDPNCKSTVQINVLPSVGCCVINAGISCGNNYDGLSVQVRGPGNAAGFAVFKEDTKPSTAVPRAIGLLSWQCGLSQVYFGYKDGKYCVYAQDNEDPASVQSCLPTGQELTKPLPNPYYHRVKKTSDADTDKSQEQASELPTKDDDNWIAEGTGTDVNDEEITETKM